jgi:hypothetical protein
VLAYLRSTAWSSTSKHHAFYFRDASIVIHEGPCRNLYSDGLTILVTANGHNHFRQRARSCVYISREAPPMARMRRRRDDQFKRISNCLKFSKSEEMLGGRVPMANRSISVDPDDCCHVISSVEDKASRAGKGASAPCPPSIQIAVLMVGTPSDARSRDPLALPTLRCCHFISSHHPLRQQFRDLNRVERGSLQQLVRRREYRDRMAAGVAEILSNAADQDVILA